MVQVELKFETYADFYDHCKCCRAFYNGCAKTCELRKRLKIPPFGKQYPNPNEKVIDV